MYMLKKSIVQFNVASKKNSLNPIHIRPLKKEGFVLKSWSSTKYL